MITRYITPVIYLYLDRYSGKGPITSAVAPSIQAAEAAADGPRGAT